MPEFTDHEGGVEIAWIATTRRRLSISDELFETYWQNCHGTTVAALPGPRFYYQHRLLHAYGDHWPRLPGMTWGIPDDEQIDGVAQLGFRNAADRQEFKDTTDDALVPEDEQNIFSVVAIQQSQAGRHRTLLDIVADPQPNGFEPCLRVFVAMRKATGVSLDDLAEHLLEHVGPALADHELLQKVRVVVCDDVEDHRAPNVEVNLPIEQQYQGWMELAFQSRFTMRQCYDSAAFRSAVAGIERLVTHVDAFPAKTSMVCKQHGEATLAGRLGRIRAQAVTDIGAIHHEGSA